MALTESEEKELERLEELRKARSDASGDPKPGYKVNLAMVNQQIAQLKKKRGDSSTIITQ